MITNTYLNSTLWIGIVIIVMIVLSPVILYIAMRNEKILLHKILYLIVVIVADSCLVGWFLHHIHSAHITLPTLIRFYLDYWRTTP